MRHGSPGVPGKFGTLGAVCVTAFRYAELAAEDLAHVGVCAPPP